MWASAIRHFSYLPNNFPIDCHNCSVFVTFNGIHIEGQLTIMFQIRLTIAGNHNFSWFQTLLVGLLRSQLRVSFPSQQSLSVNSNTFGGALLDFFNLYQVIGKIIKLRWTLIIFRNRFAPDSNHATLPKEAYNHNESL
jgi:hypothetical protein